jgi:ribosomal protein S18 acetylase RimI-like enzyme
MNIKVCKVDYNDTQQTNDLLALLNEYAEDPMGGDAPLSAFSKENLIEQLRKRSFVFSLICYVDGEPAAFTNCVEGFSTFKCKPLINIHDFAVSNKYRGLQLSQTLLAEIERIALEMGCCKVTLEVLEGNEPAKQAYIKFGFIAYELDPKVGKAMFWEKPLP